MLKNAMHEITLMIQARTGLTSSALVWFVIMAVAGVATFAFVCVAGYQGFAILVPPVFAGLIMLGIFALIALIALLVAKTSMQRARQRAILERAAHARTPSWLLDPKILGTAVQVGRAVGWQRLVPVALLGFMAAQWAREYRQHDRERPQ